jgi:hypothetical protein
MSKLEDFYKKAEQDGKIRSDLDAAQKQFEGTDPDQEAVIAALIKVAGKHGTVLERGDFDTKAGELDESSLASVAGGRSDWWSRATSGFIRY